MAVKTRAVIASELAAAEAKIESIPGVLAEFIEKYGLEDQLCHSGLTEFCQAFGTKWVSKVPASATITISGLELAKSGDYGDLESDNLYDKIHRALRDIPEISKLYPDIEFEEE